MVLPNIAAVPPLSNIFARLPALGLLAAPMLLSNPMEGIPPLLILIPTESIDDVWLLCGTDGRLAGVPRSITDLAVGSSVTRVETLHLECRRVVDMVGLGQRSRQERGPIPLDAQTQLKEEVGNCPNPQERRRVPQVPRGQVLGAELVLQAGMTPALPEQTIPGDWATSWCPSL